MIGLMERVINVKTNSLIAATPREIKCLLNAFDLSFSIIKLKYY